MTRYRRVWLASVLATAALPGAAADTGAQERSTLLEAVTYDDLEAVKSFVEAGADINAANDYGHTPLLIACNYGYEEVAVYLITKGANVNSRGKDGGTALIAAASNSQRLVELLLSRGADVEARMANGVGPFTQFAIGILTKRVPLELGDTLLAHGAEVDEAQTEGGAAGYTPLMMAARNNQEALVRFLIERGADVNHAAESGATPLSLAREEGHQGIVAILKENGAKGGMRARS